jgi:transposase
MSSPDSNPILNLLLQGIGVPSKEERRRRSIADSLSQEVYSVPDADGELGVSTETLRRWIRAGKVEIHPISKRKTRIHKDELVRLMMGSRT